MDVTDYLCAALIILGLIIFFGMIFSGLAIAAEHTIVANEFCEERDWERGTWGGAPWSINCYKFEESCINGSDICMYSEIRESYPYKVKE